MKSVYGGEMPEQDCLDNHMIAKGRLTGLKRGFLWDQEFSPRYLDLMRGYPSKDDAKIVPNVQLRKNQDGTFHITPSQTLESQIRCVSCRIALDRFRAIPNG